MGYSLLDIINFLTALFTTVFTALSELGLELPGASGEEETDPEA